MMMREVIIMLYLETISGTGLNALKG